MKNRRRVRRPKAGHLSVIVVVMIFVLVVTFQICKLRQKEDTYAAQKEELMEQYARETERTEEIKNLEEYMNTTQYIEDVAKNKLGLVYDNEIIFKESED
ncbi:MAG: septum formation initiator family protein [Agathobacter sp.]|nr:septum formation initiator family protein [Agathobacter sp.]